MEPRGKEDILAEAIVLVLLLLFLSRIGGCS